MDISKIALDIGNEQAQIKNFKTSPLKIGGIYDWDFVYENVFWTSHKKS